MLFGAQWTSYQRIVVKGEEHSPEKKKKQKEKEAKEAEGLKKFKSQEWDLPTFLDKMSHFEGEGNVWWLKEHPDLGIITQIYFNNQYTVKKSVEFLNFCVDFF